jgi:Zn-dependent peptidase ImmA (M78 family)
MSGLFLSDQRFGVAILVNFEHPRARKRFSYAHEFAHALLDRDLQTNVSERNNSGDLREKRANAFAAAFLMPEGGVKMLVRDLNKGQPSRIDAPMFDVAGNSWADASLRPTPGSQTIGYQNIATIADHFRVSYQAAVYRLKSLGIVSATETTELLAKEDEASEFMKFLDMFDAEEQTTDKPDRELVTQVAQLAIEAYRREEISRGRLMEIARTLSKNGQELLRFAEALRKE